MTPQSEPDPPKEIAALLVFGSQLPKDLLEELSIQMELFLEEVDRGMGSDGQPAYRWQVLDSSFEGQRVLLKPIHDSGRMSRRRSVSAILQEVRKGIALLSGSPRRPPMFTDASLRHLERIARSTSVPGVTRVAFYTDRASQPITATTLENVRALIDATDD